MPRPLQTVLCVDDDADILAVVSLALRSLGGLQVQIANGGQAALNTLAGGGIDLVLLDVMMPGMDGHETLEAIRKNPATAHLPVVLMTARVQLYEQAAPPASVLAVIAKPFDPVSLPTRLQALWKQSQAPADD
jgi:CheY-like chemotaxis protein